MKLYAATESKDVSFHLLHKECHGRLKQLRWCPPCERAVEWAETVPGYEYARDEHVVMSEDDFEKLSGNRLASPLRRGFSFASPSQLAAGRKERLMRKLGNESQGIEEFLDDDGGATGS